jgi:uncharacterized cupredoxin-like copper-binding protein
MKLMQSVMSFLIAVLIWSKLTLPLQAAAIGLNPDPMQQAAIVVPVSLGNANNALKFFPDSLEFTAGKHYKLVLTNPSAQKHYFTAKDFADVIWSQKVEAGNVEIKGAIHELELNPGAQADWLFVPIKSGRYTLRCAIAGHTEAGMIGELTVSASKSVQ